MRSVGGGDRWHAHYVNSEGMGKWEEGNTQRHVSKLVFPLTITYMYVTVLFRNQTHVFQSPWRRLKHCENIGKLFSKLKLVTDNLLMQQPTEKPLKHLNDILNFYSLHRSKTWKSIKSLDSLNSTAKHVQQVLIIRPFWINWTNMTTRSLGQSVRRVIFYLMY